MVAIYNEAKKRPTGLDDDGRKIEKGTKLTQKEPDPAPSVATNKRGCCGG